MQEEVWKPIVGFEDLFLISSCGRLKSIRFSKEKILKQTISKNGYYSVATKIGGIRGKDYCFKIHRLVAESFLDAPTDEFILAELNNHYGKIPVNHIDGDKLNNHYTNLEWCTYKSNAKHAYDLGLSIGVPQLDTRKLTDDDIRFIRMNYKSRDKKYGVRALARNFRLSHTNILRILNKLSYKEII